MTNVEGLTKDSIVYSCGVGFDISWDLEIIKRFGCRVYAFDPTDTSKTWLENQDTPEQFSFTQTGVATFNGMQTFFLPLREGKADYSTVKKSGRSIRFPVKKLQTFMQERAHSHIDILKLDIEGSEFSVLPQIASLPIKQILVEMHPNMYESGWKGLRKLLGNIKMRYAMFSLARNGFICMHRNVNDYTFVKSQ